MGIQIAAMELILELVHLNATSNKFFVQVCRVFVLNTFFFFKKPSSPLQPAAYYDASCGLLAGVVVLLDEDVCVVELGVGVTVGVGVWVDPVLPVGEVAGPVLLLSPVVVVFPPVPGLVVLLVPGPEPLLPGAGALVLLLPPSSLVLVISLFSRAIRVEVPLCPEDVRGLLVPSLSPSL